MEKRLTVADVGRYMRTWSSVHKWVGEHPGRKRREEGGEGDVVDALFEDIRDSEEEWRRDEKWMDREVLIEWGSALVLARRRGTAT